MLTTCILWSIFFSSVLSYQTAFLPRAYQVFPTIKQQSKQHLLSQFLPSFNRDLRKQRFRVRQVPGDGGCMFHALATCLDFVENKEHFVDFDKSIRQESTRLREQAVKTLQSECSFVLHAETHSAIQSHELLNLTAEQYNTTTEAYCSNMLNPHTWGGGPELMALAHYLQRPIHVYELHAKKFFPLKFYLKRSATFDHVTLPPSGDNTEERYQKLTKSPLEILFTDGRFPDMLPKNLRNIKADHFLALFSVPQKEQRFRDWTMSVLSLIKKFHPGRILGLIYARM